MAGASATATAAAWAKRLDPPITKLSKLYFGFSRASWAVALDALNPQLGSRLARAMDRWSALAEPYRSAAREAIARVAARPDLSADTREIVTRALEAA